MTMTPSMPRLANPDNSIGWQTETAGLPTTLLGRESESQTKFHPGTLTLLLLAYMRT